MKCKQANGQCFPGFYCVNVCFIHTNIHLYILWQIEYKSNALDKLFSPVKLYSVDK